MLYAEKFKEELSEVEGLRISRARNVRKRIRIQIEAARA